MKKKVGILFLLAVMAITALTGCGNEKNKNTGTGKNGTTSSQENKTTNEREMQEKESSINATTNIGNDTEAATTDRNKNGVVGDVVTDVSEELTKIGDDIKDAVKDGTTTAPAADTTAATITTEPTNVQGTTTR